MVGTVIPCFLILVCLGTFLILAKLFLYEPTELQNTTPQTFNTSTVAIRQVASVLGRSGNYCTLSRYTYYALLLATIIITLVSEKFDILPGLSLRLASGAAAGALYYAGVAAVHQMLIFGFGLQTQRYSTCQPLPLFGTNTSLPVCYGFDDMDRDSACIVVGVGLLAGLPMAVWSSVFHQSAARPILVLWMLLLAASHVFCTVSKTETTVHFQICPLNVSEPSPGASYVAGALDSAWLASFSALTQGQKVTFANGLKCLYSVFEPQHYPLAAGRPALPLDNLQGALDQTPSPHFRPLGLAFWAIYFAFAVIVVLDPEARKITTSSSKALPSPPKFTRFSCRPLAMLCGKMAKDPATTKEPTKPLQKRNIPLSLLQTATTVLHCFRSVLALIPRYLSAAMFFGYVIFLEWTHWDAPETEGFMAIGQLGALIGVALVIVGVGFGSVAEQSQAPGEAKEGEMAV